MTLREITQCISDIQLLTETSSELALQKNQNLFVELTKQDDIYIIPDATVPAEAFEQKLFRPYIAPAQTNDPRLFLRIFSHEDAATAFAEKNNRNQVCKIDGIELMQLAKFYFLRGIYGFLLNDGLSWTVIAFPDFLTGCLTSILGDERLVRQKYIQLIQFINMIRQNDFYHICMARKQVKSADEEDRILFVSPERRNRMDSENFMFEDLNLTNLLQVANFPDETQVIIRVDKFDLKIALPMLTAAFRATGIDRVDTCEFQAQLDFHVKSIALDFCIQDFPSPEAPITLQVQLAELPKPHDKIPEDDIKDEKTKGTSFIDLIKSGWGKIQSGKSNVFSSHKAKKTENPFYKRLLFLVARIYKPAIAIVICAGLGCGILKVLHPSVEKQFDEAAKNNDFVVMADLYEQYCTTDEKHAKDAYAIVSAKIDKKLSEYASDNCNALELREVLDCYAELPVFSEKVGEVYDTASKLEESKQFYADGLEQTSILERLSIWQNVSAIDTGSQNKIAKDLKSHADQYKISVFTDVEYMDPKNAIAELTLLQNFYPDDKDIPNKILEIGNKKQLSNQGMNTNSNSPILITDVDCQSVGEDGRHDLRIVWENHSGQIINQVTFTVAPYDINGKQVTTTKVDNNGNTYSLYAAADMGPFEDGYQTPDNHCWEEVWFNNNIETVHILSVKIIYNNGAIQEYLNENEISALMK